MLDLGLTVRDRVLLVERIADHLHRHCSEKYEEGHRSHLGASLIGDDCFRKLWYIFRWVKKPTYIDPKGKDQKGRMMRLFNRGHKEEFRFVEWLRGMGFAVYDADAATGKQYRISDCHGHYGGSLDGIIDFPPEYGLVPRMLCEFKTSGTKYFDKLKENGVKFAKPEHYAQMCTYGKRYNLRYALYMAVNKDTDEIHVEIVELDFNYADELTTKASTIIFSQSPLARVSDNSAYFKCKMCNFNGICHGKDKYEKNCRSCMFAHPIENGEWRCRMFNGIIPKDFLPKGCDSWQEAR